MFGPETDAVEITPTDKLDKALREYEALAVERIVEAMNESDVATNRASLEVSSHFDDAETKTRMYVTTTVLVRVGPIPN